MKKKLVGIMLVVAMLGLAIVGCSKEKPSEEKATEVASEEKAAEVASGGEAEYAVILKTQASDFWVKVGEGAKSKAKELGVIVDVHAAQSEEDTEGQLKILENSLNSNYKAIGVAPLSPVNLVPGIVEANEKGIYVMNIDEKIDMDQLKAQGGSVIGFATTDNVAVGEKGAQYIIDNIEKGSKVAIIEGKAGNKSGEDRKDGAKAAFESAGMELVGSLPADWDRQKALDVASSFIQQNPDLVAIYACNDGMALGALQAVINADKLGVILVVGTDGDSEAVESVEKGELAATVAQDPFKMGEISLEQMVNAVKEGKEIDKDAEPAFIPVESEIIKKD